MKLFNIGQEFDSLYSILEEVEVDENGVIIDNSEIIAQLYAEIKGELEEKLDNTTYVCKELKASAESLKAEAKRLTAKANAFEAREKKLKMLMKEAIITSGEMKHKTEKFSFNVRTSEVYNYDDVNTFGLDDEFIKVKRELDKTKIKQFVKAGGAVEGVRISEDTILTVR